MSRLNVQAFVAKQKDLLQLELRSEQGEESDLTASSVLRGLRVESASVGLYGRTVVHLESGSSAPPSIPSSPADSSIVDDSKAGVPTTARAGGPLLPSHRLTVGDEVEILGRNGSGSCSGRNRCAGGVICALDDTKISIALFGQKRAKDIGTVANGADGSDDSDDYGLGLGTPPFTIFPKSSAAVHHKMINALDELSKAGADHDQAGAVIEAVFGAVDGGDKMTSTGLASPGADISSKRRYNGNLDTSQEEAVDFVLRDRTLGLIHGPPGKFSCLFSVCSELHTSICSRSKAIYFGFFFLFGKGRGRQQQWLS